MSSNLEADGGLRAYHRRETRARIREAARDAFRTKGYKQATTREIAEQARVAHATLFRYARDKRELLLLIINDDLDSIPLESADRAPAGVEDTLIAFYDPRFRYFAREPAISRIFVAESFNFLVDGDDGIGPEAQRNRDRRRDLTTALTHLIQRHEAQLRGVTAGLVAELAHAIYLSTVRSWLETERPRSENGIRDFRRLIEAAAKGFADIP